MIPAVQRKGAVICVCGEGESVLKCWVVAVRVQCAPFVLQKEHWDYHTLLHQWVLVLMWENQCGGRFLPPNSLPVCLLDNTALQKLSSLMPSSGLGVPLHTFQTCLIFSAAENKNISETSAEPFSCYILCFQACSGSDPSVRDLSRGICTSKKGTLVIRSLRKNVLWNRSSTVDSLSDITSKMRIR